jgi:hypothetical protein
VTIIGAIVTLRVGVDVILELVGGLVTTLAGGFCVTGVSVVD